MIDDPCALVVMGVSGSGKSTIAQALSERVGWNNEDGDQYHPRSNVDKMRSGQPLSDADRLPWLQAIAARIDEVCRSKQHLVISCSALKRSYRDVLVHGRDDVRLVYLKGSRAVIAERLANRKNHFMPAGLLDSQFEILEPPAPAERAIIVSVEAPIATIVDGIIAAMRSKTEAP